MPNQAPEEEPAHRRDGTECSQRAGSVCRAKRSGVWGGRWRGTSHPEHSARPEASPNRSDRRELVFGMARRLQMALPNLRQPPSKWSKRRRGWASLFKSAEGADVAPHAHPRRSVTRKERTEDTREARPQSDEGALAGEDATTAANTAKGVAEGSDWRVRNEPPEPTIEA